jgi:magnesium transporter
MIQARYFNVSENHIVDVKPEQFASALQDPQGLLWVDFSGESPQESEPILRQTFGFHPLAVDDALQESHVPKIDDWGQFLYIVFHELVFEPGSEDIETVELDVFLGENYIVTHHDLPVPSLSRVWEACQRDDRYLKMDADHLLYKLADELVADYMQVVDEMDKEIEFVEDEIFKKPSSVMVQKLFDLKRATLQLRRTLSPQREVLNKLARNDFAVIDANDRIYFRDVYDHLVRLHDISEGLRDLVGGALDTYLSVINNRMNDIMKTLTLITTLFMPISFVAGFFGMNFFQPVDQLSIWTSNPAFIAMLVIVVATPMGMFMWMRRRGWM